MAGSSIRNVKSCSLSKGRTRAASAPIFSRMEPSKRSSTCVSTRSNPGLVRRICSMFPIHSVCWCCARSARKSINCFRPAESFNRKCGDFSLKSSIGSNPADLRKSFRTSSFMGVNRAGFSCPSKDSKYNSARFTPSQSKRLSKVRISAATASEASGRARFISLRQSSCASWSRAVFSRHSG